MVARGINSDAAATLRSDGWTISKLQQASQMDLKALGFTSDVIASLHQGSRPPIPRETLLRVLFKNRFTCCVCRDSQKGITVHHIDPWASSHDHSEANLSVLCADDHEKAHRVSALARNLDPPSLNGFKRQWEEFCLREDRRALLRASQINYDAWLYFNHLRLFEMARAAGVDPKRVTGFREAKSANVADKLGNLMPQGASRGWMYDGVEGMTIYSFVRAVFDEALKRIAVRNLSDFLDRGLTHGLLQAGDFIIVQGAHTFSVQNDLERGSGQIVVGRRRVNRVEVRFTFDRWEATSSSAWNDWLRGRQSVASLVQVKQVRREDGDVVLAGTVIAIGHGLRGLQSRSYSARYGRPYNELDEDLWNVPWLEGED